MKKESKTHTREEIDLIFTQIGQSLNEGELDVVRKTVGDTLLEMAEEILSIPASKAQEFGGDFGFFILKTFNDLLTTPQFSGLLEEQRTMGSSNFWLQHEIKGGISQMIAHLKSEDDPPPHASRRLQA